MSYAVVQGFLGDVPRLNILNETIRNLYFHVGMWFAMIPMMLVSLIYAIMALVTSKLKYDLKSASFAEAGLVFGILGVLTGMLWGNFTWGDFWPNDPKLHGAALTVLCYFAYFILRNGIADLEKKNKVSSAYNIFAFVLLVLFLIIYPRMSRSLHPGNGGNPGFSTYDLDSSMRMVFYPAVIGWNLLGVWVSNMRWKIGLIKNKKLLKDLGEL